VGPGVLRTLDSAKEEHRPVPIHELVSDLEQAASMRTEPIQERGAARVDALLDAAAAVVDEIGYDRLTTAMVAEKAGSSIGTVYRYFPDRIALLQGLRDRAVARFRRAVVTGAEERGEVGWREMVECTIDAFATMFRTEPGFRIIRFIDERREADPEEEFSSAYFARSLAHILAGDYDLPGGAELEFRLAIAVDLGQALLERAFLVDPSGDEAYIAEARRVVRTYLESYYA
jgi:AcrR family transcriptional regulator